MIHLGLKMCQFHSKSIVNWLWNWLAINLTFHGKKWCLTIKILYGIGLFPSQQLLEGNNLRWRLKFTNDIESKHAIIFDGRNKIATCIFTEAIIIISWLQIKKWVFYFSPIELLFITVYFMNIMRKLKSSRQTYLWTFWFWINPNEPNLI